MYAIRIIELVGKVELTQDPNKIRGVYVKAYNPDAYDTRGFAEFTNNPTEAVLFNTIDKAVEFYRQQVGTRPDGKPNRPLTAFSVEFVSI